MYTTGLPIVARKKAFKVKLAMDAGTYSVSVVGECILPAVPIELLGLGSTQIPVGWIL